MNVALSKYECWFVIRLKLNLPILPDKPSIKLSTSISPSFMITSLWKSILVDRITCMYYAYYALRSQSNQYYQTIQIDYKRLSHWIFSLKILNIFII